MRTSSIVLQVADLFGNSLVPQNVISIESTRTLNLSHRSVIIIRTCLLDIPFIVEFKVHFAETLDYT
jgi:hypothetical protein